MEPGLKMPFARFTIMKVCPLQFESQFPPDLEAIKNYRLFDCHIGYDIASKLDGKLITVIRNPFDRIISLYYYWRELPDTTYGPGLAKRLTLEEFIECRDDLIILDAVNTQTWQIAFGTTLSARDSNAHLSPDQLLEKAIKNLEHFEVVGVTEAMPLVAMGIRSKLGLPVDAAMAHTNVTNSRPTLGEIPVALRDRIYSLVNVDLALYQHVLERYVAPNVLDANFAPPALAPVHSC
ncbi:sulfotransferase family 2 domain-containing protein [Mesorhizobium sp. PAMC28654]|uniref:sulfotransferase domain-containing protein n=1 Tax=Mesorhizobium sp. PAMC28654 TaxID=2880934 RepID=UPI001D0B77E8|nr:sulfotransferase domain-containing protein [Mesorhizobium sp. PAMC28654]UDL91625.1 sulfotransferase family 2 domain-containing protein [Mesorhizobium sp. PAMC28654]